jgi:hypothetical protein
MDSVDGVGGYECLSLHDVVFVTHVVEFVQRFVYSKSKSHGNCITVSHAQNTTAHLSNIYF